MHPALIQTAGRASICEPGTSWATHIERDDALPACRCACDLDRVVDRLAAAVAVEVLGQLLRHDARQRRIQLQLKGW